MRCAGPSLKFTGMQYLRKRPVYLELMVIALLTVVAGSGCQFESVVIVIVCTS